MNNQKQKITYKNYTFELQFKTDYCLSMTVTDKFEGRRYQNNNFEFSKIERKSIISVLSGESPKQLSCKISQNVIVDDSMRKEQTKLQKQKQKCLKIQFFVDLQYIQPFSEIAILYEIDSYKKSENMIPHKMNEKTAKQLKKQIQLLENSIPSPDQCDEFQVYEINGLTLMKSQIQNDRELIFIIGSNVALFILWITYFTFLQYLGLLAILLGSLYLYFSKQKFEIQKIDLKQGQYKIDVTGTMSSSNYSAGAIDSFILHLSFNQWSSKQLKMHLKNTYNYAFPFNGTFLVNNKKEQTVTIQIQKNVKIYTSTLSNVVITAQRMPIQMNQK